MSREDVKLSDTQTRSGQASLEGRHRKNSARGERDPRAGGKALSCDTLQEISALPFGYFKNKNNNNNSKYLWGALCQVLF